MTTRTDYAVYMAGGVSISSTALGLVAHNPNWLLNIPIGLIVGGLTGWILFPLRERVIRWIERRRG